MYLLCDWYDWWYDMIYYELWLIIMIYDIYYNDYNDYDDIKDVIDNNC